MANLKSKNKKQSKKLTVFDIRTNDAVSVKRGYFYNFLRPKGLAVLNTAEVQKWAEENKTQNAEKQSKLNETKQKLQGGTLLFVRNTINNKIERIREEDIISEIFEKYELSGINNIKFQKNIDKYGVYPLSFHLGYGNYVNMMISVGNSIVNARELGESNGAKKEN